MADGWVPGVVLTATVAACHCGTQAGGPQAGVLNVEQVGVLGRPYAKANCFGAGELPHTAPAPLKRWVYSPESLRKFC